MPLPPMNTERTNAALRTFWLDFKPSTRAVYRAGWRQWVGWCGRTGVDPLRASVAEAQAFADSMAHTYAPLTIRRTIGGIRVAHEHLSMMGFQPYEPFYAVHIGPDRRPPREAKPELTIDRLIAGLRSARGTGRPEAIIWVGAGMGLLASEAISLHDDRVRSVGAFKVAEIERYGHVHLVPIPREVLLYRERSGKWPLPFKSANGAAVVASRDLAPHLPFSIGAMRRCHEAIAEAYGTNERPVRASLVDSASVGLDRWQFSKHTSLTVCQFLRDALHDA